LRDWPLSCKTKSKTAVYKIKTKPSFCSSETDLVIRLTSQTTLLLINTNFPLEPPVYHAYNASTTQHLDAVGDWLRLLTLRLSWTSSARWSSSKRRVVAGGRRCERMWPVRPRRSASRLRHSVLQRLTLLRRQLTDQSVTEVLQKLSLLLRQ